MQETNGGERRANAEEKEGQLRPPVLFFWPLKEPLPWLRGPPLRVGGGGILRLLPLMALIGGAVLLVVGGRWLWLVGALGGASVGLGSPLGALQVGATKGPATTGGTSIRTRIGPYKRAKSAGPWPWRVKELCLISRISSMSA